MAGVDQSSIRAEYGMDQMVFVQSKNPVLGKDEWVEMSENYDYIQEISRSDYGDMLHDDERNHLYYDGLRDAVKRLREAGKPVRVLDIGTGTGLLSMMAARLGADCVTACEAFKPMADCARKIIACNGLSHKITVVGKRSTELLIGEDLPEKANLLVAEVFDTELIGEGAISTYSHAKEHLLTPDALLVPSAANVFAQVVSSSELSSYFRPYSAPLTDLPLRTPLEIPPAISKCPGTVSVRDYQLSQLSPDQFEALSEPLKVLHFDWSGRTKPITEDETTEVTFTPLKSKGGPKTADLVFMWWELIMDQNDLKLSMAPTWAHPARPAWRDHWMHAIYHLSPHPELSEGTCTLITSRDEYSLWFKFCPPNIPPVPSDPPFCTCGIHYSTSSFGRIAQLSDNHELSVLLKSALTQADNSPRQAWLVLGDGTNLVVLGALASHANISHVYVHETSSHIATCIAGFLSSNQLSERVTVLPPSFSSISSLPHKIGTVFAEPYFSSAFLPWQSLRLNVLLKEALHLFSQNIPETPQNIISGPYESLPPLLPPEIALLPASITLMCLPVCFSDFWKIRTPVRRKCGFDLRIFDELIEEASLCTDAQIDAQPLCQYDATALTAPLLLTTLDLCKDLSRLKDRFEVEAPLDVTQLEAGPVDFCSCGGLDPCGRPFHYNGVVIWCEWKFGDDILSSGLRKPALPGRKVDFEPKRVQGVWIPNVQQRRNFSKNSKVNFKASVSFCSIENIDFKFEMNA